MPGVLAVYHADGNDLGLPPFQSFPMLPETFNRPVFARDRVRFVGDIVAAIVAESGPQAVDAAEAVIVDVDPLPAVIAQKDALASDAPLLFPEAGSNVCFATSFGDDEDPLAGAEVVAEVDHGEPAPSRRADGAQRLSHGSRRAARGASPAGYRTRRPIPCNRP